MIYWNRLLLRRIDAIKSRKEERECVSGSVEGQWHPFSCRGVKGEQRNFRGFRGGEFFYCRIGIPTLNPRCIQIRAEVYVSF